MATVSKSKEAQAASGDEQGDAVMRIQDEQKGANRNATKSLAELAGEVGLTVEYTCEVLEDHDLPFARPDDPHTHGFTPNEVDAVAELIDLKYLPAWTQPFGVLTAEEREASAKLVAEAFRLTDE